MPDYTIRDPQSGRTVTLRGDSPPTEQELHDVFAQLQASDTAAVGKMTPMAPMASHVPEKPQQSLLQRMTSGLAAGESNTAEAQANIGPLAVDAAKGAKAGATSTMYHGGDVLRRGYNIFAPSALQASRPILTPEVQAAMTPPNSAAGKMGFGVEQAAEFGLPLGEVSKAAAGASLLKRAALESATSGAVAGVQSGDAKTAGTAAALGAAAPMALAAGRGVFNGVRRAASGAQEGGIGGALAGLVRSSAPVEPKAMLVQAIKPRASQVNFEQALERAVPELKATEHEIGKPIESIDDLLAATKQAKQRVRAQYDTIAGPKREMGSTVDLTPVADAMDASIPKKVRLEDPEAAARIAAKADIYRRRFPLDEAEQLLRETNAELDAFYDKYPQAQRKALMSNPEIAHTVAQADALRTAIYATLDDASQGGAARELNRRYGALLDVEDAAYRRSIVSKRQQPESLSQQIGKVRAAGEMAKGTYRLLHGDLSGAADIAGARAGRAMSDALKEQQTTNNLIKRAMAAVTDRPVPVQMPQPRRIAGLLNRGPVVTPPPADASFVRGVQAQPAQVVRKALPAGREPIQAAPAPDPSFVRGVPAEPARREIRGLLTGPRKPAVIAPQPETSVVRGAPAKSHVQRDPRHGRMRRVFTSESK